MESEENNTPKIVKDNPFYGEYENPDGTEYERFTTGNIITKGYSAMRLNRACFSYTNKIFPNLQENFREKYGSDFINNGWEWVTFKTNDGYIKKVPCGVFPDVNDEKPFRLYSLSLIRNLIKKEEPDETVDYLKHQIKYFVKSFNVKKIIVFIFEDLPDKLKQKIEDFFKMHFAELEFKIISL